MRGGFESPMAPISPGTLGCPQWLVFRPIVWDKKEYEVFTLRHSWPQSEGVSKETPIALFIQIGKLRHLGQNYTGKCW